jgi:hypothetical protein
VEEPTLAYNSEKKVADDFEMHPVLIQLLEKSINEAAEGKLISHDEVMKRKKEKFPFLK